MSMLIRFLEFTWCALVKEVWCELDMGQRLVKANQRLAKVVLTAGRRLIRGRLEAN